MQPVSKVAVQRLNLYSLSYMRYFSISRTVLFLAVFCLFLIVPTGAVHASGSLKVAGWIPYWHDLQGIKDVRAHLKQINTLYPFVYSAQPDGSIKDLSSGLDGDAWRTLFVDARNKHIEIIPTVMWSDGSSTQVVLSDPMTRKQHIAVITSMVERGKYDGVDIDYESKRSETKDSFSAFLTELKAALKGKLLTCTIEARTPPDSAYKVPPATIEYSNDYAVIGKVCDRVQLMAYDQQRADISLDIAKTGQPYIPVSDVDWVRKVVDLAIRSLPKEKIMLGIATYGHHYEVTVSPNWYQDYRRIGALNIPDILDVAKEYKAKPSKNNAGEMSFTYIPKSSTLVLPKTLTIPKNTPSGNIIAAQALAYANKTGETVKINFATWSDVNAMTTKINLAKELRLRGVSLFKFDGEEDSKVWSVLK